ncbi:MAG: hypothetical protein VKJ04_10525 [Vampirovibrionales bacterium]|nr:hypothetical protein [Vampirovibrionales bacterium]
MSLQSLPFQSLKKKPSPVYGHKRPYCLTKGVLLGLALSLAVAMMTVPVQRALAADTHANIQALLNKANTYAGQDNFAAAVPLYEQAVAKLPVGDPNAKTLHKNLQVLYVNYAVTLTNKKQYAQAESVLQKAKKHDPADTHVTKSLAALYFNQAMDLREQGQNNQDLREQGQNNQDLREVGRENSEAQNFEEVETLLKKAIALSPNEPNFKRGLAANYFDNGLAFANQDDFTSAVPLLEAAHKLEPTNANIKQSLANVYLSLMQRDEPKRQEWADKALVLDSSEKTKMLVESWLHPEVPAAEDNTAAASDGGKGKRPSLPPNAGKLTIQDMVLDIENQWGIERNPKARLAERVETIETQVNGKKGEGPLAMRVQTLYAQLYGAQQAQEKAAMAAGDIVQGPVDLSDNALKNSYIAEVFKMTDGKVIRWAKFPVRVYIEEPSEKENTKDLDGLYKSDYKQAVLDGIGRWKEASGGNVNFIEVKNELAADIIFRFGKAYVDRFADPDKVPGWYQTYSTPKVNNKLVTAVRLASMFTPGFFSLIPMAVGSGLQYQQYKKLDVIREESIVTLGLEPVAKLPEQEGIMLLQNISAKEFGHALGIKALSPDSNDLLYPQLISDHAKFPTKRDMATLTQLYTRPANVLLNVQAQMGGQMF